MEEFKSELRDLLLEEDMYSQRLLALEFNRAPNLEAVKDELGYYDTAVAIHDITKMLDDNPYLNEIKFAGTRDMALLAEMAKQGGLKCLANRILIPGRVYKYSTPTRDKKTLKLKHNIYTVNDITFLPSISEFDEEIGRPNTWMTVEPSEITSFEKIIDGATGNVLLLGCGLCYSAFMIARKPEVTSVTIVELNPQVIELARNKIISQFPKEIADKIILVEGDALDYMRNPLINIYNYVNVDIWRDETDMLFNYLQSLAIAQKTPNAQFTYWLEDDFLIAMQYLFMKYFSASEYLSIKISEDAGMALMQTMAKDIIEAKTADFKTPEDFKAFINMDIKEFRRLLLEWYSSHLGIFQRYYNKSSYTNKNRKTK